MPWLEERSLSETLIYGQPTDEVKFGKAILNEWRRAEDANFRRGTQDQGPGEDGALAR